MQKTLKGYQSDQIGIIQVHILPYVQQPPGQDKRKAKAGKLKSCHGADHFGSGARRAGPAERRQGRPRNDEERTRQPGGNNGEERAGVEGIV